MAQHNDLGKEGEKLALQYLIDKGYTILEKNYRYLKAEIDIIAKKDTIVAAVEVKTRTSDYFGNPEEFVNTKKIKLLLSAMDNYMNEKDLDIEVRFDIIAILKKGSKTKIEHLEDAFLYF